MSAKLGGPPAGTLEVFDAKVNCKAAASTHHWDDVLTSEHLSATERDGDVVLGTMGDGVFERE